MALERLCRAFDGLLQTRLILDRGLVRLEDPHSRAGRLGAILSLWRVAGIVPGVSDSEQGLANLTACEPGCLLIAERDGEALGTLIAGWDGWRGSFYRLAVRPDSRRRGLATALLHEGERRLRARGAVRLTAIVADDDPGAIAFWQSVGYAPQSDRVRFIRHLG